MEKEKDSIKKRKCTCKKEQIKSEWDDSLFLLILIAWIFGDINFGKDYETDKRLSVLEAKEEMLEKIILK